MPRRSRLLARLYATYLLLRWSALLVSIFVVFVVSSSLAGASVGSSWLRLGLGLGAALALPVLLRGRLRQLVARRLGRRPSLGGSWFLVLVNGLTLAALCVGFCDETGRALRRRGDWFLGSAEGWLPRRYRARMGRVGRWLERFDLPPEARTVLADAAQLQPDPPPLPPPPPENLEGPPPPPPPPLPAAWFHPIEGPRSRPPSAGCRFGAPRPGPRPPECELGHCGVDLFVPTGTPVFAVHDGVVRSIQRDAERGGISGKFVILEHKGGAVRSTYVHLDRVAGGLRRGDVVTGGKTVIGTVGATGCKRTGPHLHFGLSVVKGRQRFVDPEPLLELWRLPEPPREATPAVAVR